MWLANCVLLAEQPDLVSGFFERDGLEPPYRHKVFTSVRIVNELAVVMAPFEYF